MSRKCRLRVIISLSAFFFFSSLNVLFSQETEPGFDQGLVDKLVEVYDRQGEEGLRIYAKAHTEALGKRFVYELAEEGESKKRLKWLNIASILAKDCTEQRIKYFVYLKMSDYYRAIDELEKSIEFLRKFIQIEYKVDDPELLKSIDRVKNSIDFAKSFIDSVHSANGIPEEKKQFFLEYIDSIRGLVDDGYFYIRQSDFHFLCGDVRAGFRCLEQAMESFNRSRKVYGKRDVYIAKADAYSRLYMTKKAIKFYKKALQIYKGARIKSWIEGQIKMHLRIAGEYQRLGQYDKAMGNYRAARLVIPFIDDNLLEAVVLRAQAFVYKKMGEYASAFEMLGEACELYRLQGSERMMQAVFLDKVKLFIDLKMYAPALVLLQASLEKLKSIDTPLYYSYPSKVTVYAVFGFIYGELKLYEKSLAYYKQAESEKNSWAYQESILSFMASALEKVNRIEEAYWQHLAAIKNQENVRNRLMFPESKKGFENDSYGGPLILAIRFFLTNGYYPDGFKVLELLQARLFLEKLSEGMVPFQKGITQDLIQKRDALIHRLSRQESLVQQTSMVNTKKEVAIQLERYRQIESEFEELLVKIRLECPLYSSVRYFKPATVAYLQEKVLKEGEFLVRFFHIYETVGTFIISRDSFRVLTLDGIDVSQLKELVGKLKNGLSKKRNLEFSRVAHQAYKEIFKPLEEYLEGAKDLIIVPDGELVHIPFEALIVKRGSIERPPLYLLEKYRIKYVQSASVLGILRQHYRNRRDTNRFIGFGDPVYDYKTFAKGGTELSTPERGTEDEVEEILRSKYDRAGGKLKRLKGTGEEVSVIARIFNKRDDGGGVVRLREKALEEVVKSEAIKEYDYIHFACHGLLAEGLQSLVLSRDVPKHSEDGYLTLNELMNCDFNAKLVVLSACDTGSENKERGEGVTGLTRAVMYAGTPAVVASLWKVDDEATKESMIKFYENMLRKKMPKAEALRQAKLALLNSEKYSSPQYWSAFVMYGE